jgi:hypothetical protein
MKDEILEFLEMIGVNCRFISLYNGYIYINNLKFSRFSRRREELFQAKYPHWKVIRSKIFQKICVRASRVLSKSLKPKDKVFILNGENCADFTLQMILEPYTRKYGIEIILNDKLVSLDKYGVDCIASSLNLDREVENIIKQMFKGEKIESTISRKHKNQVKIIYPLINIPEAWIESWANECDLNCEISAIDKLPYSLIEFLEEFIPEVKENMLRSALYSS